MGIDQNLHTSNINTLEQEKFTLNTAGDVAVRTLTTSNSTVDVVNSTSTPLAADAVFTGEWVDVLAYTNISVLIYNDQQSEDDGLCLQFSTDGVHVDEEDCYYIPPFTGKQYSLGIVGQYFRVVYTNGNIAQENFRLQTIFHPHAPKASSHKLSSGLSGEDDAELVKSVITAEKEDGNFYNIKMAEDGHVLTEAHQDKQQFVKMMCVLNEILGQLKLTNMHMQSLTEIETCGCEDIDHII